MPSEEPHGGAAENTAADRAFRLLQGVVYANAFVTGFLVLALEMLGSRYLTPYFGGGIYTWAGLIATVLVALAAGNIAGGRLADRRPSPALLGALLLGAGLWLLLLPSLSGALLEALLTRIEDVRYASFAGALGLLFVPQALLGVYSPFAIRLVLRATAVSGAVSGRIYGISTLGGIAGTLGTTFYLLPMAGTRAISYGLAAVALLSALSLLAAGGTGWRGRIPALALLAGLVALAVAPVSPRSAMAQAPPQSGNAAGPARYDPAALLLLPDGIVEELETEHTRIFIRKHRAYLFMTFRLRGKRHTESIANLKEPADLPAPYTRVMTAALLYVEHPRNLLMLGLGGGTTSRYLQRHLPGLSIRVVELDPGVITLAKKYFGVRESPTYRISEGDARVYLNRNADRHDIIMVDAYRADYIPFHLMTQEFYRIAKARLKPGGVLVMNLIHGNRLFGSTMATLRSVFQAVDTYGVGGQVVVAAFDGRSPSQEELRGRAARLQKRHGFHHDLRAVARRRRELPAATDARVLTDDFAPVNLYGDTWQQKRTAR